MEFVDWGEELKVRREQLRSQLENGESELQQSIGGVIEKGVRAIPSNTTLRVALECFESDDIEYALVQDSPDSILGVVRRNSLHAALVAVKDHFDLIPVNNIMDRRICVEPLVATVAEVMDRMAVGGCACTVLVDDLGRPHSIVSPKSILMALKRILPKEVTEKSDRH